MATESPRSTLRSTVLWLALFFALAVFLRIGFSLGAGFDDESQRYMYTGNDPYYHDRTVHHILETGEHLSQDCAINYPDCAPNPNPPIYTWTAAPVAWALDSMGTSPDPVGLALNIMVAVWGALTVIPVYMVGRDLFGRKAGLWAGLFIAVSAPHIQRSVAGYADHDATTMFFITLAVAFLVKAFKALDTRDYVPNWKDGAARASGIKAAFAHNKPAMTWSAMAGLALTATALTWKGYPYIVAVMAIGLGLQLLIDHLRRRDSTALFAVYLVPLVMIALLPYLFFYRAFPGFLDTTVIPTAYVVLGALVAGLILVPTRNLPSIVVFPGLAVMAILGLVGIKFLAPDVWAAMTTGLGYFQQSKLYSTIAEARRAPLGLVAASFGFFTFLLAFWGFGKAVKGSWKGQPAMTLMVAWAAVAIFMAFRASRFIMNAAPVFAILVGPTLVAIVARLGFEDVRRRFAAQHGQGTVGAAARSLSTKSVVGALLVGLFLVLPNVWIGVDAGMPAEYEAEHGLQGSGAPERFFGAFGINYELGDNGWRPVLADLATRDTGLDLKDRPAVIAWWDYGHWVTSLGEHPAVADPFQHHFTTAGRFLASESEAEAQAWLVLLLVNNDWRQDGEGYSPGVKAALEGVDASLLDLHAPMRGNEQHALLLSKVSGDAVFDLYEDVADATGKRVDYFAADIRMYPVSSGQTGIFYAPVFLADKNPDDFIQSTISGGGRTITIQQYGMDDENHSFARDEARFVETVGGAEKEWVAYNGYLYPKGQTPLQGYADDSGIALDSRAQQITPTERFYNSMYNRAFGSYASQVPPGEGLTHWRTVAQSTGKCLFNADTRCVVILESYQGVLVSGKVVDDAGAAVSGSTVGFMDGYGAVHGTTTTAADGTFTLRAPFAEDGDLSFVVRAGSSEAFRDNRTEFQFTREQAKDGATVTGITVTVPRGTVSGTVYRDSDGVDGFNATAGDVALSGATVSIAGQNVTTGADGTYTVAGVQAGSASASVSLAGHETATRTVAIASGETTTADFELEYAPSEVTFQLSGFDNLPVPLTVKDADGATVASPTADNSTAVVTLDPGAYTVEANWTANGTTYTGSAPFTVNPGGADLTVAVPRDN